MSLKSKAVVMIFLIQMIIRLTIQSSPINFANSKQMPNFPSIHLYKTLSFSLCNSFDQLALQSLNNCKLSLFLPVEIFRIWGLVIYRWKGIENTFPMVYYTSQNVNIVVTKRERKICSGFGIVFLLMSGGRVEPLQPPNYDTLDFCTLSWENQEAACGCEVPTNLNYGYSIMKKTISQHFILCVTISETRHNQYWHQTWFSLANDPCTIC